MATPSEKLADFLELLHKIQNSGNASIKSAELGQTHRERLLNGFRPVPDVVFERKGIIQSHL